MDRSSLDRSSALQQVRVVLSHTSHPGNIGSAARAMKTMGLSRLYLVNPKHFPDPQAEALASGAADVLSDAIVCATLDEALVGTRLAIAVTARRRDLSHPASDAREAMRIAIDEALQGEVAIVFGTEMSGLSNEEVMKCRRLAHIPANPEYSSLNLAAAVQVLSYELRMATMEEGNASADSKRFEAASHEELEALYGHLEASMTRSGFLDPQRPRRLMERVRRLFGRAALEKEEVNILRGMVSAWETPTGPRHRAATEKPSDELPNE